MLHIKQFARSPEAVILTISPSESDPAPLDMTTVTVVELRVERKGGETATWDATIQGATIGTLTVIHSFDSAGAETAQIGAISIGSYLTVPTGFRRGEAIAGIIQEYPPF